MARKKDEPSIAVEGVTKVQSAESVATPEKHLDFNDDNRRISRLLREDRQERQLSSLRAQNRKLKQEVARLREEYPRKTK